MSQPNTVAQLIIAKHELEAALAEEKRCRINDNTNWLAVVRAHAAMLADQQSRADRLELELAVVKRQLHEGEAKPPQGW